jgi:hypothetical protein
VNISAKLKTFGCQQHRPFSNVAGLENPLRAGSLSHPAYLPACRFRLKILSCLQRTMYKERLKP